MGIVWVLAAIALLVVLQHRRFGGTDVQIDDGILTIAPRGLDKLWSFLSKMEVPIEVVTDVRVDDPRNLRGGWKFPGTCLPGWIIAGRYVRSGEWSFWNVHRADRVLVLALDEGPFSRIVVEVDDPVAEARRIMAAAPHGI